MATAKAHWKQWNKHVLKNILTNTECPSSKYRLFVAILLLELITFTWSFTNVNWYFPKNTRTTISVLIFCSPTTVTKLILIQILTSSLTSFTYFFLWPLKMTNTLDKTMICWSTLKSLHKTVWEVKNITSPVFILPNKPHLVPHTGRLPPYVFFFNWK